MPLKALVLETSASASSASGAYITGDRTQGENRTRLISFAPKGGFAFSSVIAHAASSTLKPSVSMLIIGRVILLQRDF